MFGDFVEELREETNRWFDLDHVPQRLSCPGFLRAERYEQVDRASPGPGETTPPRYLNVYARGRALELRWRRQPDRQLGRCHAELQRQGPDHFSGLR
jgi:hypothetical protein